MNIIEVIKYFFNSKNDNLKLENWYFVKWDEDKIYRTVNPPFKKPWNDFLNWKDIQSISFEANDLYESDCIYIFIKDRKESFAIPTESNGGSDLWNEIIRRKLFDAELAIEAASSTGGLYTWPPIERK